MHARTSGSSTDQTESTSDETELEISAGELAVREVKPWKRRPQLFCGTFAMHDRVQWYPPPKRPYTRRELLADQVILLSGACLAWPCAASISLLSFRAGDSLLLQASLWAHGVGLVVMLNFSALLHFRAWDWSAYQKLLSLDHIGITSMLMGCYAPVMIYSGCRVLLAVVCAVGAAGILSEGFRFASGSQVARGSLTLLRYLMMGWAVVVVSPAVINVMPSGGIKLIVLGGVIVTGGVPFFITHSLEFHTAIWHACILGTSICYFVLNTVYILGSTSEVPNLDIGPSTGIAVHA